MPEEPSLYLFAIPAVLLIGLAKGGFSGLGALGTLLLAIGMDDPVRAAAILLPILIAQDIVGVAAFRKSWDGSVLAAATAFSLVNWPPPSSSPSPSVRALPASGSCAASRRSASTRSSTG